MVTDICPTTLLQVRALSVIIFMLSIHRSVYIVMVIDTIVMVSLSEVGR